MFSPASRTLSFDPAGPNDVMSRGVSLVVVEVEFLLSEELLSASWKLRLDPVGIKDSMGVEVGGEEAMT